MKNEFGESLSNKKNDGKTTSLNTIFLGGPIQHAICYNSKFNSEIKNHIESLFNNLIKEYRVLSAHMTESFGKKTSHFTSKEIVERDFLWMRLCDVFIAVLPDNSDGLPFRTDGTLIEIGWASILRKPIILLSSQIPVSEKHSHLVRGLSVITEVHFWSLSEALDKPSIFLKRFQSLMTSLKK